MAEQKEEFPPEFFTDSNTSNARNPNERMGDAGEFSGNIQMEVNVGGGMEEQNVLILGLPEEENKLTEKSDHPDEVAKSGESGHAQDDSTEGIDLEKLLESCFDGVDENVEDSHSQQTMEVATQGQMSSVEGGQLIHTQMGGGGENQGRVIILQQHPGSVAPDGFLQTHSICLQQSDGRQISIPTSQSGVSIEGHALGTQDNHQQQIVIPLDELGQNGTRALETGHTVLLPVIPTLNADGVIEMRLATNALQNVQFVTAPPAAAPSGITNTAQVTLGASSVIRAENHPSTSLGGGSQESKSEQQVTEMLVDGQFQVEQQKPIGSGGGRGSRVDSEPGRIFKCRYCDYNNAKRYLLVRHMKSHSEERPFKCTVCERSFKTNSSLQNHVNTHTGTKPFKCKTCPSAFTTSGEMVRHMRYIHTKEKPHQCPECEYATVELSKLKRHMRSHTGERPFKCQVCPYSSPDMYKLKRHMRTHTGERPYECDTCLARFSQSNSLKAHRLIHTPDEKPSFKCQFCPTTCGRKTDLKLHVQKQHTSDRPIPCVKCGTEFPDKWSWKQHQKTHEGQKCFTCPQCSYSAFSQRHLEQHTLVHANQKSFQCPEVECGKSFRQHAQLKRHVNLKHNPSYDPKPLEKVHPCPLCGKNFKHPGNLKKHHQMSHPDGTENPLDSSMESAADPADATDNSGDKTSTVMLGDRKVVVHIKGTRKSARQQQRRPEDLGLTNIRLKGRPRNAPPSSSAKPPLPPSAVGLELEMEADEEESASEEEDDPHPLIDRERTEEISREVETAFGFKDLAEPPEEESVKDEVQNEPRAEPRLPEES